MEIIIRLLWILFMLFFGIQQDMSQPVIPLDTGNTLRQPILIDSVNINVMESFPMQISLDVEGTIQDGCQFPVIVEQTLTDNTITVQIYREVPADVMCPAMIGSYTDTISLEGTFEPGEYTIIVNNQTFEIKL